MSYTIGTIIYGVTIPHWNEKGNELRARFASAVNDVFEEGSVGHQTNNEAAREKAVDQLIEEMGFQTIYEGASALWFGIHLGEMDETEDYDLSGLPRIARHHAVAYNDMVTKLPKKVQDVLPPPTLQIVWSSS